MQPTRKNQPYRTDSYGNAIRTTPAGGDRKRISQEVPSLPQPSWFKRAMPYLLPVAATGAATWMSVFKIF